MPKHLQPLRWTLFAALAGCTFPDISFATGGESSVGGDSANGGIAVGASGGGGSDGASGGTGGESGLGGEGGKGELPDVPVSLGTAADYVVLAESGITNVPPSTITGSMGVSPIAVGAITGFLLMPDASGEFSTSLQVSGNVYAASHMAPTPSKLIAAVADMQLAFGEASARLPQMSELGQGSLGGMTLTHGVYSWSTPVSIPTTLTLTGSATDVWVFQIAQTLTVSSAAQVFLTGGALPQNVFWRVSGAVDLGTASHLQGIVLSATSIAMHTGASFDGRLLAQTAVTFEACSVTEP